MHDPPTTIIGVMHVALRIPLCASLKEKRSVLKPCIHHLRDKFNLAVSEIGDQDRWRSAILAMATLSSDKNLVESTLRKALHSFDQRHDLEVIDQQVEIL